MSEIKMNVGKASKQAMPMSKILAMDSVKVLGENLNLTQQQQLTARSYAMQLSADEKLANVDQFSIIKFAFETIRYGFARTDAIYPVPFKGKVQAMVSYKGFREIALRTGKYSKISAIEVRKCDKIIRDSRTGEVSIEFNQDYELSKTSEVIGYFAFALSSTVDRQLVNFIYMSVEEIETHAKKYSKSYNGLWSDKAFGFPAMAKKTVIKFLLNELEQTAEMASLNKLDQIVFGKENEKNLYEDNKVHDFTNENESEEESKQTTAKPNENGEIIEENITSLVEDDFDNDGKF